MTLPASGAISLFAVNDELGLSHSAQIGLLCTNVRTLFAVASGAVGLETGYGKSNTSVPGIPTGVSASASSSSAISVSFSAPACTGHLTIDYYQVVCTGSGTNSATGSSPISVSGLSPSTAYTFKVRAHNSKGYGCYSSTASATTSAARGCIVYCTIGTYNWTAPAGVTSVSVVVVRAGCPGNCQTYSSYYCGYNGQTIHTGVGITYGGNGGALAWRNNISVTPGSTYPIYVGAQYYNSWFNYVSSCCAAIAKTVIAANNNNAAYPNRVAGDCWSYGGVGMWAGRATYYRFSGALYSAGGGAGGGAAGYSRSTPTSSMCHYHAGGSLCAAGQWNGVNGAGASGNFPAYTESGGGGGGVGLYGRGSNGSFNGALCSGSGRPALSYNQSHSEGGGGGSGGSAGGNGGNGNYTVPGGNGGNYGGGGGAGGDGTNYTNPHFSGIYQACTWYSQGPGSYGGAGGKAAVRIIWPGCSRLFPTTDVGSP